MSLGHGNPAPLKSSDWGPRAGRDHVAPDLGTRKDLSLRPYKPFTHMAQELSLSLP